MIFLTLWQTKYKELKDALLQPHLLAKLKEYNELNGHEDLQGRITYNKIVDKKSFGQFNNIVSGIVPLSVVLDPTYSQQLPSFVKTLKCNQVETFTRYVYMNMNMDEFDEWENEEDQDSLSDFFSFVNKHDKPTVAMGILRSEAMQSAHAFAIIAWKQEKTTHLAFYDSLAYRRKHLGYDFAERSFDPARFDFSYKVKFHNLGKYCAQKEDGQDFHCPQYVMNAEYCYVYSLYFLTTWITTQNATPSTKAFRKAVTDSYIVPPEKLTRSDTRESFIFRVIMMSFTMCSLDWYLRRLKTKLIPQHNQYIKQIKDYSDQFDDRYGVELGL